MIVDQARHQARILAEHPSATPRHIREALAALADPLRAVCEGLAPETPDMVMDALYGLLAAKALTPAQRAALLQPLAAQLAATMDGAPAPRSLRAVRQAEA